MLGACFIRNIGLTTVVILGVNLPISTEVIVYIKMCITLTDHSLVTAASLSSQGGSGDYGTGLAIVLYNLGRDIKKENGIGYVLATHARAINKVQYK